MPAAATATQPVAAFSNTRAAASISFTARSSLTITALTPASSTGESICKCHSGCIETWEANELQITMSLSVL